MTRRSDRRAEAGDGRRGGARYRFGDFVLDPARYRLERGGEPVEMEPRVLEVLTALVAEPRRVHAREELLEAVWGGRPVGETALSRCLYEARKSIGDDRRETRWIRTIHGRGVVFDREVEKFTDDESPPPEETGGGAMPIPRLGVGRTLVGRTLVGRTLVLFSVLVAVSLGILPASRLLAPAPPPERPAPALRVGVLPLSLEAPDRESERLALAVLDALEETLDRRPTVIVRRSRTVAQLAASEPSLISVARHLHADLLVSGQMEDGGDGPVVRLFVHRFSPPSTHALAARPVRPPASGGAVALLHRATEGWREEIDEIAGTGPVPGRPLGPAPAAPSPPSPEAFRLYLHARSLGVPSCRSDLALELLERALRHDPTYHRARLRSGAHHLLYASGCGFGPAHWDAALAETRRLAGDPSLRGAHLGAEALVDAGELEAAWELLARQGLLDLPSRALRAEILALAGATEEALRELDRIAALDSGFWIDGRARPPWALLDGGREDELIRLVGSLPGSTGRYAAGLAAFRSGREELARQTLEPIFRSDSLRIEARLSQALLAEIDGADDEALEILRRLELEAASLPLRFRLQVAEQRARLAGLESVAARLEDLLADVGCSLCLTDVFQVAGAEGESAFVRRLRRRLEERRRELERHFGG